MATTTLPPTVRSYDSGDRRAKSKTLTGREVLESAMSALASLKLTVALFALGIFVVFIGTLAQTEADIWEVVRDYFRSWIMLVDLGLLFPPSFFPGMHQEYPEFFQFLDRIPIPFPGGMTIGVLMAVNLIAAHTWRFKVQATGAQLWGGLSVIAAGIFLTLLVIVGGHNSDGFQAVPWFSWTTIWYGFLATVGLCWLGGVGGVASWVLRSSKLTWRQLVVISLLTLVLVIVPIVLIYALTIKATLGPESLRILWQLLQGTVAGAVLLAGCILVFRKRAGVVLLHGGIGLLMLGELFVSRYAVEAQVFLGEGHTTNYVRDIRTTELAIIDPSGSETDEVVVVPRDILERNARENARLIKQDKPPVFVQNQNLPFDIAVLEYHKNADVRDLQRGEKTLASKGRGLRETVVPLAPQKGTDTDSGVDMAAVYVRLRDKKGEDLGTYLLSQLASEQQNPSKFAEKVKLGDATYDLFLRFRRDYKPYQITLKDVRKDDYLGTNTPMNYSSDVRIVDETRGVDREVKIWMNNPLRYAGETFYQSGYHRLADGEYTTLAVVKNTGWMIPYVACMLVSVGLCAHFLITLSRFLNRSDEAPARGGLNPYASPTAAAAGRKKAKKASGNREVQPLVGSGIGWESVGLPLLMVGLFAMIVGMYARPPKTEPGKFDYVAFGKLPVVADGRVKPIDTIARTGLRTVSDRETISYKDDKKNRVKASATEWFLDIVTGSEKALEYRVFRIDNPEVRQLFGLQARSGLRYSVKELRDKIGDFEKQTSAARDTPKERLTIYQKRLLELEQRLTTYMMLVESFSPPQIPPKPTSEQLAKDPSVGSRWIQQFMLASSARMEKLDKINAPLAIPMPEQEAVSQRRWIAYPNAWTLAYAQNLKGEEADATTLAFDAILSAYGKDDPIAFNRAVAQYNGQLQRVKPSDWNETKTSFEAYFNHFSPFYVGMPLYIIAFLLAMVGWLVQWKPLNWAAFTLILLTFVLHTGALVARIYISGRPPVTNLYSSAVFIGWGCVFFGLTMEAIYRLGLGNLVAAVCGYATLQIAYFLAAGGDTIAVLQAVLDTQFWLATHVVCISLGYTATFVAGMFGVFYILFGLTTPLLNQSLRKDLARMIYGTVCFAIFFSFVGTVLGGLWADDSWGRFWGWDPKENGALIIVLWNALVLHARWDKMIADRGLAVLSIGGNIVTAWSWFGVNELGIGLHSYGFTEGVLLALGSFVLSQMFLIGIGLIPTRLWWSYVAERQGSRATTQLA